MDVDRALTAAAIEHAAHATDKERRLASLIALMDLVDRSEAASSQLSKRGINMFTLATEIAELKK